MATAARGGRTRPSQVLPLPSSAPHHRALRPAGGPPPPPGSRSPGAGGRARAIVLCLSLAVVAILGASTLVGTDQPAGPAPVTDVVTEDAVIAVLQLYTAEVALAATVATADPFAVPGPAGRARDLQAAIGTASGVLSQTRADDPAAGTPGAVYTAHPDHDALLEVAVDVGQHTVDLGVLDGAHGTLFGGVPGTTRQPPTAVVQSLLARDVPPAARTWAEVLLAAQAGDRSALRQQAEAARGAAGAEWRAAADQLGPAALEPLTELLNGIDPGVIVALEGHPVAGPALAQLRR